MSLYINCIAASFFWRHRAKYMVLFAVYEKVRHAFPYFSKTVRHVNEASIQRKWRKLFKAFVAVKSLVISDCDMDKIVRGMSARGVNFGFWSHLGCSGQNAIIFSREGLV